MTREEATNLVEDLLQALIDYERCDGWGSKTYRQEYLELKERVIAALTSGK